MSVGTSKNDCSNNIDANDDFSRLQLKYSKQSHLLHGTKVKLPKYRSKDVYNLQQKYTVKTSADFLQNDQQFSIQSEKQNSNLDICVGKIKSKRSNKNVAQTKYRNANKNELDPNLEEIKDQKLIGLKNIQSPLYEINSDSNPIKQITKHLTIVTKTISKDYKSKSEANSDLKIIKLNALKNELITIDLTENETVKNFDTDSNETKLKSKKSTESNIQEQNQSKETPPKINAFAFMMGNRYKVIGTNSDGEDKEVVRSAEIVKGKKQKNWAEKKVSATKRKLEDQAQEKYIARTLNKHVKRMKKTLNINDDEIVKNQTKKTKNCETIIIDSDSSNYDFQENSPNLSPKNKTKDLIKMKTDFTPKNQKKFKCSLFGKKSPHKSKTQSIHDENEDIYEMFRDQPTPLVSLENKSTLDGIIKPPATNSQKSKLLSTISNLDIEDSNSEQVQQFTPRTWRTRVRFIEKENVENENTSDEADVIVIDDSPEEHFPSKLTSVENSPNNSVQKHRKLAPLFLRKSKKDKQAALQAKKNFLFSTSSSTKQIKAKPPSDPEIIFNYFPKVSHVQQREVDTNLNTFWNLPNASLGIIENDFDTTIEITDDTILLGTFTKCQHVFYTPLRPRQLQVAPIKLLNIKQLIQEIKNENDSYPVLKIFRQLCDKNGITAIKEIVSEDTSIAINVDKSATTQNQNVDVAAAVDSSMWTEKYKPQSRDDIIGNSFSVDELKSWLSAWLIYSEDHKAWKRKRINSNRSDDFCSNSSTRDTGSILQNTIILTGAHGSGKTASVYALCNELSINVIEINASSKRTGKMILRKLQEATQSHQVKNTQSKSVGSYFQSKSNKTQEESNKKLSLLLVEDIDVVFADQDDGFLSALRTLVRTSKRPMIFTTTDPNSSHVQKLISQHPVVLFKSFSANTIGTWLQILCLVENVQVNKSNIVKLLQWNNGDIRKTMLQLQFWTQTGGDPLKTVEGLPRIVNISPHSSWLSENDINLESRHSNCIHQSVLETFVPYYERDNDESFQIPYPANLGTIWWNMSNILNIPEPKQNNVYEPESRTLNDETSISVEEALLSPLLFETQEYPVHSSLDELDLAKNLLDSLSFADIVYTSMKVDCDLEPTVNYWQNVPSDSLSLSENLATYDASNNVSMEIVHWLLENNIKRVQKNATECVVNVAVPSPDKIRRRTKQHNSMKELLVLVPLPYVLERRAICADYQPMLRLIIRMEAHRCLKNTKHKRRIYHYLKNLNLHLSNSTISSLCNTLAIDKHTF